MRIKSFGAIMRLSTRVPPYEMLDPIVDAYIEKGPEENEIAARGFEREVVRWVIGKANANEYKRRQMAPGLKVTVKAFGRGRRIPIAVAF